MYISEKESPPTAVEPGKRLLRGKALLNEYLNLRSSLNYNANSSAASLSSNQSSAKCFNDRARSLSFKSRYYAWLLRSSANSLAQGNKTKANKIILDALINDTSGLLSKHSREASSSHGCDSEYDNYKPGMTGSDAVTTTMRVKPNLFLKKTFWSTDDDDEGISKRKAESLLQQKQKIFKNEEVVNAAGKMNSENNTEDEDDTCRLVSCKEMSTITERTEQTSLHETANV